MTDAENILQALEEAAAHSRGGLVGVRERRVLVPDTIDIPAIRKKLGLTQQEFALRFGFSLSTVRNWEQGARIPPGSARVLLTVIARNPQAVLEALEEGTKVDENVAA